MSTFEMLIIITSVMSGIGVPAVGAVLLLNGRYRTAQFVSLDGRIDEIFKRLDHIDECTDQLKERVLSAMANRNDLAAMRQEANQLAISARLVISNEFTEINARIRRLEDRALNP